jgi:hypothetical protein
MAILNSTLILNKKAPCDQVVVIVAQELLPQYDETIKSAFADINVRRREQKLREHYASTRYRIVEPPEIIQESIQFTVAPINFAFVAVIGDSSVPQNVKDHAVTRVEEAADKVKRFNGDHVYLNPQNYVPLGIEVVIITSDDKTLLRRRGNSVLTSRTQWDVSFSGYCGENAVINDRLKLSSTASYELLNEIGLLISDTSDLVFTGIHRSNLSNAIDVLAYWPLKVTSQQLANLLTEKAPKSTEVFLTTKKSSEAFVWDFENLIVDFDLLAIMAALNKANSSIDDLMPEAKASLTLAFQNLRG